MWRRRTGSKKRKRMGSELQHSLTQQWNNCTRGPRELFLSNEEEEEEEEEVKQVENKSEEEEEEEVVKEEKEEKDEEDEK